MVKAYLEPMGDFLLVVDNPATSSLDGIELPDNMRQQEMAFGTVISVGPACSQIRREDIICMGPYAGKHVIIEGIQFRLLREGQVEGRVKHVAEMQTETVSESIQGTVAAGA